MARSRALRSTLARTTAVVATAAVAIGASAGAASTAAHARVDAVRGPEACAPGAIPARIAGIRVCLRAGTRCRRAQDRAYHRYRFHCHTGRLTPFPQQPPSLTRLGLRVAGPEEVVFDWTTDRCDLEDIPDLPARAFRDAAGAVHLFATHYVWREAVGATLADVRHRCDVLHRFHGNDDPAAFDDREWPSATYTEDGVTVHALVHMEYQGHLRPARCNGSYAACWNNAITLMTSLDGGRTWSHATPPAHLVAPYHLPYEPLVGPVGLMSPSNVFRNPRDGFLYAFVYEAHPASVGKVCLMRTRTPGDPASWRGWNGVAFEHVFSNPYVASPGRCAAVATFAIGAMSGSVTWNEELRAFVLVGWENDTPERGGFFVSFSRDLLRWTHRQRFMQAEFPWTFACGDPPVLAYPSLLDPDSASRNFDTTDRRAYVYFTRMNYVNCRMTLDRDLVRVPVELTVDP
jgi:hypothetical protein